MKSETTKYPEYILAIYRNLRYYCASTVSSTDGQSQMRFKSPYASSIRETVGQNFFSLNHGTGYAAVSLEYGLHSETISLQGQGNVTPNTYRTQSSTITTD